MGQFTPRALFVLIAGWGSGTALGATYNLNHQCQVEYYNGKTWDSVPQTMLQGRVRDPLTPRGDRVLFFVNKRWYRTEAKCLTRNDIDPMERGEAKERETPRKWAIEVSGGYALLFGNRFQDRSVVTGGYTTTTAGEKSAINLAFGVNHLLRENFILRYFASRMAIIQNATITGSATGTLVESHDFYHFGIGATKFFPRGKFKPFVGLDLGYTLDSGLYTYSDFTGIFEGLNGGVDINASGVFAGIRGGADYAIKTNFSVFADLVFQHSFLGDAKVAATTTTFYSADETVDAQPLTRLVLSLGVRYWF